MGNDGSIIKNLQNFPTQKDARYEMPAVVRWHLVSVTTLADGGGIKDTTGCVFVPVNDPDLE